MTNNKRKLPEEKIIYEYTNTKANTIVIARKYHVDQPRISEILKRNNIPLRHQPHLRIGDKFGDLTIVDIKNKKYENTNKNQILYLCRCTCGKEIWIFRGGLLKRKNKSCGCKKYLRSSKNRKDYHGLRKTKLYKCWANMKSRCFNNKTKSYLDYGARGITVCNDWLDFKNFKDWAYSNGYKDGLTLERINVNKNYCPSNCTWIEKREQSWNRRDTRYITYRNISKSVGEWCSILGLKHHIIYNNCKKNNWKLDPLLEKLNIKLPDNLI